MSGSVWGLVAPVVFKTIATRLGRVGWVRFPYAPARRLVGVALAIVVAMPVQAQVGTDTSRQRESLTRASQDSLEPPLSPGRAFVVSLLVPGLAQSQLRRTGAGALYFTLEAVSIAMLVKSRRDLALARRYQNEFVLGDYKRDPSTGAPLLDVEGRYLPADSVRTRYDSELVRARRTHVEDWISMLIFNHLFAGADAFVASLLWDLPAKVELRLHPRGASVGVRIGR